MGTEQAAGPRLASSSRPLTPGDSSLAGKSERVNSTASSALYYKGLGTRSATSAPLAGPGRPSTQSAVSTKMQQ